jgi:hypothetical protein
MPLLRMGWKEFGEDEDEDEYEHEHEHAWQNGTPTHLGRQRKRVAFWRKRKVNNRR